MSGTVLDLADIAEPHQLACAISNKWHEWKSARSGWEEEKKELRNFLYATDTRTTSNKRLPWANSTTTPKLTQIYDNLKANYIAALFPKSKWSRWEAEDNDAANLEKAKVIHSYITTKLRQSEFNKTASRIVDDWIQYGNCFGMVEWVEDYVPILDEEIQVARYVGPKLIRISPHDIVFNPTASDFSKTPKIVRSIVTMGEAKKLIESGDSSYENIFDRMTENRRLVSGTSVTDKSGAFIADGFGSIEEYYGSDYVEILTFYGDIYDSSKETLKENVRVVVADRAYIVDEGPIESWLGNQPIYHSGWRNRPDNLYAMGPLDNLVGMQYRIDHLENLKADIFDMISMPMIKIKGDVEDFEYNPAGRIYLGDEGEVDFLHPDTTALQANFEIRALQDQMEEMAGAPRQAMGIRTPGEKTAFEVQALENSASRIFQHKAAQLEIEFIEPVLNAMLECARRKMNKMDTIRVVDDDRGYEVFQQITRSDIVGKGKLVPTGASHFAERAQRVQNINQLMQIKATDPTIGIHLSGKTMAKMIAEELGEDTLYKENVGVDEQMETASHAQDAEADMQEEMQIKAEEGL